MDAGGTSPWTGEGRTMQEQLSRATQEQLPRVYEPQIMTAKLSIIVGLRASAPTYMHYKYLACLFYFRNDYPVKLILVIYLKTMTIVMCE
jgi:hypothetical protein